MSPKYLNTYAAEKCLYIEDGLIVVVCLNMHDNYVTVFIAAKEVAI